MRRRQALSALSRLSPRRLFSTSQALPQSTKTKTANVSEAFDRLHQRILEMYESAFAKDREDVK